MMRFRKKTFIWQGLDAQQNFQQGTLDATNLHQAQLTLMANDLTIIFLQPSVTQRLMVKKTKTVQITHFLQQLTTLLESNIPLKKALQLCHRVQATSAFSQIIQQIANRIEQGHSLSQALSEHPRLFDAVLINMVKIGEQSGTLNLVLRKTLQLRQNLEHSKNKIKKALLYPCTLMGVSFFISLFMLLLIVPQFEQVFSDFGAPLPFGTQWVLHASQYLQHHGILIITLSILCFSSLILFYKKISIVQRIIHRLQLNTPIVASILNHTYQSRFYYLLAMICLSKLTIPDALLLIANNFKNYYYQRACHIIHEQVMAGDALHQGLSKTRLFPFMDCDLIAIAEESGQLVAMLQHMSLQHQQQVDTTIDHLGNLLEPCMMIIIGLIIGGLVITMYLPIFNMGNIIS